MAVSLRAVRRRIGSVKNLMKITKAMEMVASAKMRKAQERALMGRPYAEELKEVVSHLATQLETPHPLMVRREIKKTAVIHITADRGLCGGYNSSMNRMTAGFILNQKVPVTLIPVGRKGRDFMVRTGQDIRAEFIDLGDRPGVADISPIARTVIDDYTEGLIDQVYVAYSKFISVAVQRPTMVELLPIKPPEEGMRYVEYIYEPNAIEVLSALLPRYIEMELYHAVLEAIASEQSARMLAMRRATDNGNEMLSDLTLTLNKARQAAITTELMDITAGARAMERS